MAAEDEITRVQEGSTEGVENPIKGGVLNKDVSPEDISRASQNPSDQTTAEFLKQTPVELTDSQKGNADDIDRGAGRDIRAEEANSWNQEQAFNQNNWNFKDPDDAQGARQTGQWLENAIKDKFKGNDVSFDNLRNVYTEAKWPDGTPLSKQDLDMAKEVLMRFSQIRQVKDNWGFDTGISLGDAKALTKK
ncbi:MAG: hypothetical protein HY711_06450 [Candidatus Melainabacteria bacterium]|nr:hypothetical protein [Candidatus Melainabacteria bacterium]